MITITARDAAGIPIPRAKVTVTLVAGPRPTDPGFVIDDNHTIVTGSQHLTNQAGNLELDLASTDDGEMDPPGCFYLITAAGARRTIEVPATGDYDWGDPDIALIDPASPEAAHGLPAGGTDGQVLTKSGTTPYSAGWEDAASAGGGVSQVAFDAHLADSTSVHGITDTSALATSASVTAAQAYAIQRGNHTGTQAPSTIAGTAVVTGDSRLTDSRTPTAHASTHGPAGADSLAALLWPDWMSVDVYLNPSAHSNWSTFTYPNGVIAGSYLGTDVTTVGSWIEWTGLQVKAGSWEMLLVYRGQADSGIVTPTLAGVTGTTIDTYNSPTANNLRGTSTFTIPAASLATLRLTMATKSGSSSAFRGQIQAIGLRRTA